MRILHVTLANPKFHNGGLNRYCKDLIVEQEKEGHEVYLLYPGSFYNSRKPKIIKQTSSIYCVINALPVPITYGIDSPERYMVKAEKNNFSAFLKMLKPDIIHVHSIMGIHKEFFEACKNNNIKMIFTTHDFFPLCFKCNMLDTNQQLCLKPFSSIKCCECNCNGGLKEWKQVLLQSSFYHYVKKLPIVNKLKKTEHAKHQINQKTISKEIKCDEESFMQLHKYYSDIINLIYNIHCNSELTESFYVKEYGQLNYRVIPITHAHISKQRHIRKNTNKLRISYFGGPDSKKGYDLILKLIEELPENDSWTISFYGGPYPNQINNNRVFYYETFDKKNENEVWENTDLLLFLSRCPETFGFSALEALAKNIPIICTELTGIYQYVRTIEDCCCKYNDPVEEISKKIQRFINYEHYCDIQKKLQALEIDFDIRNHSMEMMLYYGEVQLYE